MFSLSQSSSSFYSGKHILITGGSSGIGKSLAKLVLSHGASVTLVARNADRLSRVAAELSPPDELAAATRRLNTVSVDCADESAVSNMTEFVENEFGPVDILVCCAGCAIGGYFEKLHADAFRSQMESNYFTAVFPAQTFFKRMAQRRCGHIVFVSSMAGQTGVFGNSAYCPAKYAVRGLAETLYFEGKPFGINITVVYPPDTDTPGFRSEEQVMPPETVAISDTGGLFNSDKVAKCIADGIRRKQFKVTIGFIGYLLGVLTAGMTPNVSLADVFLAPITRAITPFFLWDQNSTITKGHRKRFPDLKNGARPTGSDATDRSQ